MTAIFLTHPQYQITLQRGLLQIHHPKERTQLIPWHNLQRLVIGPGITLTSDVILKLAEKNVELLTLGQQNIVSLNTPSAPNNDIRLQQYAITRDPACRLRLQQRLINTRIAHQQALLNHFGLSMPITTQKGSTQQQLMLGEAHHSQHYWQQWVTLLSSYGFTGRQRRPPRDPVNALLSLTATLEEGALARALLSEGLDIGLGLLHCTGYHRQSLVLDVLELTRVELEMWVINLLLHHTLTEDHFVEHKDLGCLLNREGQRVFYPAWHRFAKQRAASQQRLARYCNRIIQREVRHAAITLVD